MGVYAGIDEAGYGPLIGPLVVGAAALEVEGEPAAAAGGPPPELWDRLQRAVCRNRAEARGGRIAVADSKKLYTPKQGARHLERGVLAFAHLAGERPDRLDRWLARLDPEGAPALARVPWYAPTAERPWPPLPGLLKPAELAVDANALTVAAQSAGVRMLGMRARILSAGGFNAIAARTRNKASLSFGLVAAHLDRLWRRLGTRDPLVVIDRQGGRTHYAQPLMQAFPRARLTVLEESPEASHYRLVAGRRAMSVRFAADADADHLPVALASMVAKHTRELLMQRLQAWFTERLPEVPPTAGYGRDARRFREAVAPHLGSLGVPGEKLFRIL